MRSCEWYEEGARGSSLRSDKWEWSEEGCGVRGTVRSDNEEWCEEG